MQVVQNLCIIPEVLHPRCRLPDAASAAVGEVLYIPVYDLHTPHAGPVAVLEALLSATATDSMLVANFISVVGNVLSCMQVRTCVGVVVVWWWRQSRPRQAAAAPTAACSAVRPYYVKSAASRLGL